MADYKNLDYNNNPYTPEQWSAVKSLFRHRRIFGIRTLWVADEAGRREPRNAVSRWIYDRDLGSLVYPFLGAGLIVLAMVMAVIGVIVL